MLSPLCLPGRDLISSSPRPDRLYGTSSLISNGYRGVFPGRVVKLITSIWCRDYECVELYLHSPYVFMAWCIVMHRDSFTRTERCELTIDSNYAYLRLHTTDQVSWRNLGPAYVTSRFDSPTV